jgi:uncharacterized RDD family membrane protein YckC
MSQPDPNPYAAPAALGPPLPHTFLAEIGSPPELATRWQRFLGALIDGLIMLPLALAGGGVIVFAVFMSEVNADSPEVRALEALAGLIIGGGLFLAVHGYLLATRGQTVGKLLLKTQIVSNDGRPFPFWRLVVLRYLPLWLVAQIPGIGHWVAIANALAIFRESRKCLHDDIAGTKVIQLRG